MHAKYLVVSLLVKLNCGERLDLCVLQFISGRIHLSDDDAFVVLVLFTKFVVDRDQLLAVSAPKLEDNSLAR
jgi:hypothetical protein